MAADERILKKMFPHLYKELESGEAKVPIEGVRRNPQEAEEAADCEVCVDEACEEQEKDFAIPTQEPDKLRHFNPCAVDFIRRCDTATQAEEIIAYLLKKGEVTSDYAKELRCQLKEAGVRSFGPKKEENYYFREGGLY